jgi:hypothetical protein
MQGKMSFGKQEVTTGEGVDSLSLRSHVDSVGDSGDGEMSQAAAAPIHLVLPGSELTASPLSTPSLIHSYRGGPVPSSSQSLGAFTDRLSPRPSAASAITARTCQTI